MREKTAAERWLEEHPESLESQLERTEAAKKKKTRVQAWKKRQIQQIRSEAGLVKWRAEKPDIRGPRAT